MSRHAEIPFRNRNHPGWWVFREVQQWVSKRQKKLNSGSRCLVWVNLRLLKAPNREKALQKALKLGRLGNPSKTNGGEWRFAGISLLLPVYENLEDGSEVLWEDGRRMSVRQIKKMVKAKGQLPVFNDKKP